MLKTGISRRRFMKLGLTGLVSATSSLGMTPKAPDKKEAVAVSRTSMKRLHAIPTTCEQCPAGCGIIAYLDGERLVQILGNPAHPNNQGSICAKGIAGINLLNDPERLLYPMKRIGSRGSGKWSRITWDEAYFTLSNRIKEMRENGTMKGFVVDMGQDDPLLNLFNSAVGITSIIDRPALKNINREAAFKSMIGDSSLIEDVARSRTILNFGANPFSNHDYYIGFARRLVLAQAEKGAKIITFDVRMSETSARSDEWIPVKAGTDSIVALAIAKMIVEKGLADEKFLNNKSNQSLLDIKHHLSQYTQELAENESGVSAASIEKLAIEFATKKPSVAIFGGGVIDHENGYQSVRCISLLNWLVGNLEKEGGLFFPRFIESKQSPFEYLHSTKKNSIRMISGIAELKENNAQIETYFACQSNPAYADPDCKSTAKLLKDEKEIPYLIVMDTHLTETALLADMVLPAATYLEGWGIKNAPSLDTNPILNLRQPVATALSDSEVLRSPVFDVGKLLESQFRPRGEAKEIGNVCLELARRLGGTPAEILPFKGTQDYTVKVISTLPELGVQDGFESLKRKGLWFENSSEKGTSSLNNKRTMPGKRQKVEIYSQTLKNDGSPPLPEYQSITLHREKKKNEFILTTFKPNLHSKGTANSKWAREILHENRLWINKKVATRLKIKNGEKIRILSPVGTLIVRALTTHLIQPESVALAEGLGHTAVGNVAKAKRFKSVDRDTELIWWMKAGNGVNPFEIIEPRSDPIGGGLSLKDTVVKIEKIK